MYVRSETTLEQIESEILRVSLALSNQNLSKIDRIVLHEELDYLESFLPSENC